MTDYTKTVNFAAKDSLSSGDSNKIVRGTEINTEFDNIATAIATKLNSSGAVFTNPVSFPDGSASSPAITNTGDTNCGLFFSAADTLAFTAGGTAQITFSDGLVAPVTDNDVDLGTSSLQFKDAFINGTLEADAITIAGVTLAETIADTVGAMVSGNTETNITVTYDDSDNTLDFAVGTVGSSTEITVSANNSTDETVYPLFVDGATGSQGAETDTGLSYNPSSGLLSLTGFGGTGSVKMPVGTTAQRDGSPAAGLFRYNSTTGKFEGYTDSWGDIGGGEATITVSTMTGDGSDTTLTLSAEPPSENAVQVYFDGVYQHKDTFSVSGTTLTFSTAPPSGVNVEAMNLLTVAASTTPADTSVTTAKLASNAVTTAKITDANVTTAKITDANVTTAKIADSNVTTAKIADSNVTTAKIADDAVTSAKLAHALDVTTSLGIGGGSSNGVSISQGAIALKNGGTQSKIDFYCESSNAHYTRLQAAPHANYAGNIVLTLPASDGDSGQALITDGSGVMSWSTLGGAYNDWAVKTTTYTAVNKDQLIANHASTAFTITLPSSPSAGNTVIIKNVGAALVTVGRNSSNIDSVAADGSLPKGNAVQLVYVDGTIGWASL
jgi:hypothetical protein